ncbi:tRNA nucleotidyltransferase (CCA-adding enzyme) [Methanophagales archaeon]|nr:tRNA nucleotidyltransferase (CCA-adding enzyme) [Methanophagales archaeon]
MTKEEEEIKRICNEVIERIRPDDAERARVKAVTDSIIDLINQKALAMDIEAHAISVGSTARNTWVHGETDIDIFIMFPEDVPEEVLKENGLALAKSISDRYEERYASHPYIHAYFYDSERITEYEADLVPCFALKDASTLKSAVDRTPFHNGYIMERIQGLEDDVLLLKLFMMCLDIYGSELRRKGFSGYLCELLILNYSSFVELLSNASRWCYGERIDLEGKGKYKGEDPLIVIDPVDRNRNVAAAVSEYSFCRFIDAAREFLTQPQMSFFLPRVPDPMSAEEFAKQVKNRGTVFVMVLFEAPETVEDILFPQLRKAEVSITNLIERAGFKVYGSDVAVESGKAFLLFELLIWSLPRLKEHMGPPVTSKYHSEQFKNIYASTHRLFIVNGRYTVEVERRYTDVVSLLKNELISCSLGKDVSESIGRGYEVLRNEEIRFVDGIGYFLSSYFRGI